MNISNTYGQMATPSENTDVVGNTGSPAGINSSLLGYANVETAMPTGYISPSNSSQYVKRFAIMQYQQRGDHWAPSSYYGGNL